MSLDISPFTEQQWWAMCDLHMHLPVPLAQADVTRPFVYDRKYGLFYVPMGHHQASMSLLLAFALGLCDGIDAAEHLKLEYSDGTADHWLQHTPGAAFRSSVGKTVQAGKQASLTVIERRLLGQVEYLF